MQQDQEWAWKEFEKTGSIRSYLCYRGITDTPQVEDQKTEEPADAKKAPSMQA